MSARRVVNGNGQVRWVPISVSGEDIVRHSEWGFTYPIRYRWRWYAILKARLVDRRRRSADWRDVDA